MKEHPIIFSAEMIRAILAGRKTMTRRVIKPQPFTANGCWQWSKKCYEDENNHCLIEEEDRFLDFMANHSPYGVPGDRLWVRETWCAHQNYNDIKPSDLPSLKHLQNGITYMTDVYAGEKSTWMGKTRSPRFMPRWASRIDLLVKNVRAERLQKISEEDAIAEGIGHGFICNAGWPDYEHINKYGVCELTQDTAYQSFASLWDSINAKRGHGWDANPWVWVIEFDRLTGKGNHNEG